MITSARTWQMANQQGRRKERTGQRAEDLAHRMAVRALRVVQNHPDLTEVQNRPNLHGHHFHGLQVVVPVAMGTAVEAAAVPEAVEQVAAIAAEAEDRVVAMTNEIAREAKARHDAVHHRHRRKYARNG